MALTTLTVAVAVLAVVVSCMAVVAIQVIAMVQTRDTTISTLIVEILTFFVDTEGIGALVWVKIAAMAMVTVTMAASVVATPDGGVLGEAEDTVVVCNTTLLARIEFVNRASN